MLAWIVAVITFAAAAAYVIGGREFMRQLIRRSREVRSQAAAALQPPTQAEIQRATPDTASDTATYAGAAPVSVGLAAVWIGGVLVVVVAMFYLTGRQPRKRRRD